MYGGKTSILEKMHSEKSSGKKVLMEKCVRLKLLKKNSPGKSYFFRGKLSFSRKSVSSEKIFLSWNFFFFIKFFFTKIVFFFRGIRHEKKVRLITNKIIK